jgi:hypothetical protein
MNTLSNKIASIKVDVYGQADNDTKHVFTYPDIFDPTRPSEKDNWLRAMSDPRDARIFSSKEIYAYWKNRLGNYYSLIVPNMRDSRGGLLMITVFTGEYIASDGKQVITTLRRLKQLVDGEPDKEYVARVIGEFAKYLKQNPYPAKNEATSNEKAFRRYRTEQDLAEIFQFTEQAEYAAFRRLLIVPATSVPAQLPAGYKEITSPIKHTYHINESMLPQGVKVSKSLLQDGDTLTITYSANGYTPISKNVRIDGKDNNHLRYDGVDITVYDSKIAGIILQRRIKLNFIAEGMQLWSLPKAHIYCNNQICQLDRDRYITLPHPIAQGTYKLRIDAYGYRKYERNLEEAEIQRGQVDIHLIPEEKTVSIRLYVKGEIIKGNVSLKGNDPLYQYLREVENANRELNKYSFKTIYGEDGKPKTDNNKKGGKKTSKSKRLLYIIISLIILVTLLFLYFDITPWSFNNNNNKIEETDSDVVVNEGDNLNSDSLQMADSLKREHDIYWLKGNDVWRKDSLQTQEYKKLCDYIASGQIHNVLSTEKDSLFYLNDLQICNGYWLQIISYLNAIKDDTEKYNKAVEALKEHSKEGKIDLNELKNALNKIATKQQKGKTQTPPIQGGTKKQESVKTDGGRPGSHD